MQAFADLLDHLIYTRSRDAKIALLARYLSSTPDPDRGWALAALTGGLSFPAVKPSAIRALLASRFDPVLVGLSRDYVGDTAETASLLWPDPPPGAPNPPSLSEVVTMLQCASRADVHGVLGRLLDRLDEKQRFAALKLATGAMRTGVSSGLAKTAFAKAFNVEVDLVEEVWHGQEPPYEALFAWAVAGGRGAAPRPRDRPVFRPFMLAHPLETELEDLAHFAVEYKWDGVRVQVSRMGEATHVFTRGGDEVSATFPEIADAFRLDAVVDGELLVRGENGDGSFNALQQRLNRKTPDARFLRDYPAFVRLYDVLAIGEQDLRAETWTIRRARLEQLLQDLPSDRFDLSPLVAVSAWGELSALRAGAREAGVEGVMLKRRDSPYVPGRRVGLWYKWKHEPLTADCVLMYAQRGSGKRSGLYSDFTFGCWTDEPIEVRKLLPVGKAYFGFTDEELAWLDSFVRRQTVNRFGPVREVEKTLVLEIAFDSLQESTRHKSGLAMRFPRIKRIRTDKPAAEADTIATLRMLLPAGPDNPANLVSG